MDYKCHTRVFASDTRGNVTQYNPGDTIKQTKYKKLNITQQAKFSPIHTRVTVDTLLDAIMDIYQNDDDLIYGNYSAVWYALMVRLHDMGYSDAICGTKWVGYRGNHIAQAGRKFQVITGDKFDNLCPDLRQYASDWSN